MLHGFFLGTGRNHLFTGRGLGSHLPAHLVGIGVQLGFLDALVLEFQRGASSRKPAPRPAGCPCPGGTRRANHLPICTLRNSTPSPPGGRAIRSRWSGLFPARLDERSRAPCSARKPLYTSPCTAGSTMSAPTLSGRLPRPRGHGGRVEGVAHSNPGPATGLRLTAAARYPGHRASLAGGNFGHAGKHPHAVQARQHPHAAIAPPLAAPVNGSPAPHLALAQGLHRRMAVHQARLLRPAPPPQRASAGCGRRHRPGTTGRIGGRGGKPRSPPCTSSDTGCLGFGVVRPRSVCKGGSR